MQEIDLAHMQGLGLEQVRTAMGLKVLVVPRFGAQEPTPEVVLKRWLVVFLQETAPKARRMLR